MALHSKSTSLKLVIVFFFFYGQSEKSYELHISKELPAYKVANSLIGCEFDLKFHSLTI